MLDDNVTNAGYGEIFLPLMGSADPSTPLWLTGWSLDIEHIKGFTLEINVDSQGEMGSTVTGAFDMFNMSAMAVVYDETDSEGTDIGGTCVAEQDLYLRENSASFKRKEFLGNKCCEVCQDDETCLYALSNGRDCYIASYMEATNVGILNTDDLRRSLTAFWMDDASRRGDFCDLCECRESDRTIDCRSRDLLIIPKTFYHDRQEDIIWTPRVLDLRNNSKLAILGSGALKSIENSLEELRLPKELRHISMESVKDLPKLSRLYFEESSDGPPQLSNVIMESSAAFADVCCSRGERVDLSFPAAGLTFCDMIIDQPGIDSTYMPFIAFNDAALSKQLFPSSNFMAEAAESPEKCAEYCAISNECKYFSYDARLPNAVHDCSLYKDTGMGSYKVCCDEDHFADEAGTIPGWTSGLPPRTRHEVDNARVILE